MSERHLKTHSDIPQEYHLSYKREKKSIKKNKKPIKEYSKELTPQRTKTKTRNTQSKLQSIREQKMIPKRHTQSFINVSTQKDTFGVTRRKKSTKGLSYKIRDKTQDFKIVSNCLRQYVKEQKRRNQKPQYEHVLKFIKAFNKSEIGSISKPLECLIDQILNTIQQNMIEVKNSKDYLENSQKITKTIVSQQPTVKKNINYQEYNDRSQMALSNDIQIMNKQLQNLRKQETRLRNLKQIISDKQNHKEQITNLQKILRRQQVIIKELEQQQNSGGQSEVINSKSN